MSIGRRMKNRERETDIKVGKRKREDKKRVR